MAEAVEIGQHAIIHDPEIDLVYVRLGGDVRFKEIMAVSRKHKDLGICRDMIIDARFSRASQITLEEWKRAAINMGTDSESRGQGATTVFVVADPIEVNLFRLFNAQISATQNPVRRLIVPDLEQAFAAIGRTPQDIGIDPQSLSSPEEG